MRRQRNRQGLVMFAWHDLCIFDIAALMIGFAICFFTMYYADITVTARFSLTFIDSLLDGKTISFYQNALASGIAPEGAVYDIGIYIIFALWGLPVWILEKVVGLDPMSVGSLIWFKLLLVMMMLLSAVVMGEIAKRIEVDESKRMIMQVIYLLSFCLFFPVVVVAQYDILPLFFMLSGIYYFINGNNKRFYLCFAIAMVMKPFAILPFIAIVLLYEKRILFVIRNVLTGISMTAICKIIYSFSPEYRISCGDFFTEMLPRLLRVSFSAGNVEVSLFMFILFCVYIFCFHWKEQTNKIYNNRLVIWIITVIWFSFSLLVDIYPYWSIYLAPFLILTVFMFEDNINLALILELAINITLTAIFIIKYPWVYGGGKTFQYLLLSSIYRKNVGTKELVTVAGIMRRIGIGDMLPIVSALSVAAGVCLLTIAWKEVLVPQKKITRSIDVWHIRIRIILLYGWIFLCLIAFFFGIGVLA